MTDSKAIFDEISFDGEAAYAEGAIVAEATNERSRKGPEDGRLRLCRHPLKKRPYLLFEILIGLSLTGILLTFLFSFFAESAKMEKKLETMRSEITARQNLQTRLQAVLTGIARESSTETPFYTDREQGESLVAVFDNGIDPDPAFSGQIIGRIYLDEQANLSLATWPLERKEEKENHPWPWRKEILLSNIEGFEFEFLSQKKEENRTKKEKTKPVNSKLEWRYSWPKSRSDIPSMIRLSVRKKRENEPLRFAFLIPSPEPIATYKGKEGAKKS